MAKKKEKRETERWRFSQKCPAQTSGSGLLATQRAGGRTCPGTVSTTLEEAPLLRKSTFQSIKVKLFAPPPLTLRARLPGRETTTIRLSVKFLRWKHKRETPPNPIIPIHREILRLDLAPPLSTSRGLLLLLQKHSWSMFQLACYFTVPPTVK